MALAAVSLASFALADPQSELNLVVLRGEGAINRVGDRTSHEIVVRVEDRNQKPIGGMPVVFTVSPQGPGGTFVNGSSELTVFSDGGGRAVTLSFQPNHVEGTFQIHVGATFAGKSATAVISQTNTSAATTGTAQRGFTKKLIIGLVLAGAAATAGVIIATHTASANGTTYNGPNPPNRICISLPCP